MNFLSAVCCTGTPHHHCFRDTSHEGLSCCMQSKETLASQDQWRWPMSTVLPNSWLGHQQEAMCTMSRKLVSGVPCVLPKASMSVYAGHVMSVWHVSCVSLLRFSWAPLEQFTAGELPTSSAQLQRFSGCSVAATTQHLRTMFLMPSMVRSVL